MRPTARAIVACALAAALSGCVQSAPEPQPTSSLAEGTRVVVLEFDGLDREYTVVNPAATGAERLPVLIALHGAGGSAEQFALVSGLPEAAQDHGFVLVVPDGTGGGEGRRTWNAGACCGPAAGSVDDVGFLARVIDDVKASFPVDPTRIYIAGFSNGGMLAYRAACELGAGIRGIAVVAGAQNVAECPAPDEVALVAVHGTDDAIVPYSGGERRLRGAQAGPWQTESFENSVGFWVERDGCGEPAEIERSGPVEHRSWPGCEVEAYVVHGGGHTWFGASGSQALGLEPAGGISASDAILDFFDLN